MARANYRRGHKTARNPLSATQQPKIKRRAGNGAAKSSPSKKSNRGTKSTPPATSWLNPSTGTPPLQPSASLLMPPNWMDHYQKVINSLEIVKTFPVSPNSVEYSTLTDLCDPLKVLSIDQIVNPELFAGFANARRELFRSKSIHLPLLTKLGLDAKEIQRIAHISANFDQNPAVASAPYWDNVALLFHCTKSVANLNTILKQGLDDRLSVGGLLGRGIYFADNPSKSSLYDGTKGVILICAVLLGDCLPVDRGNGVYFVREPEKSPEQKRHFNDNSFDSIIGRPLSSNEYVIFDRRQCLPLYQVRYQREGRWDYARVSSKSKLYSQPRLSFPPISWTGLFGRGREAVLLPNPTNAVSNWPFLASNVFSQMGVVEQEEQSAASEKSAEKPTSVDMMYFLRNWKLFQGLDSRKK